MPQLKVTIKDKIATADGQTVVCGNSDYTVKFTFDAEWSDYTQKTMRVQHGATYTDVVFSGDTATIPVQSNVLGIQIGVFAGNLHTTTPAYFDCVKSIQCAGGAPVTPTPSVYAQIMALLNGFSASVSKTGNTATITIIDPEGTTTAQVQDGAKGDKGDKGDPGDTYDDTELRNAISGINGKIPSQATAQNQLADKSFVNSSIATNTAYYISDNGQPFASVAALQAYAGTVTNNDYAFVTGTDESGNAYFDRYKATVGGGTVTWAKEYRLNNSSFTAAQWAAIQSGITAALVSAFSAKYDKPSGGIPSTDMSAAVQTSLGKADSAVQTPTSETYTIAASAWSALASSSPFNYCATVTAVHTIGQDTVCRLINDNAVLFATYGFAIGVLSGQSVTIYSIGQPSASVTLEVDYYG